MEATHCMAQRSGHRKPSVHEEDTAFVNMYVPMSAFLILGGDNRLEEK